jgi:hypothetical protein
METAAATSSQNRIEETLFSFNTASIVSQLNSTYGVNGWTITSATVTLNSSFPTGGTQPGNSSFNMINAGSFQLSWLSNNTWNASGGTTVTYDNISTYLPASGSSNLLQTFGTYYYFADGTTPLTWSLAETSGFLADILSGGEVTIFSTPADNTVGYLFNTNTKGDPPVPRYHRPGDTDPCTPDVSAARFRARRAGLHEEKNFQHIILRHLRYIPNPASRFIRLEAGLLIIRCEKDA